MDVIASFLSAALSYVCSWECVPAKGPVLCLNKVLGSEKWDWRTAGRGNLDVAGFESGIYSSAYECLMHVGYNHSIRDVPTC